MEHMTQTQARQVCAILFRTYGLDVTGWTLKFDNARRRAGQCDYRNRVISLSKPLMEQRSYDDTANTITHEMAHALVGPKHGHDYTWARKHRELGGDGKRCFEHVDLTAPWIGTCPHGKQHARYRAPQRLEGWRCRCPGSGAVVWQKRVAA